VTYPGRAALPDDAYIIFLYDVSRSYADLDAAPYNIGEMKVLVRNLSKQVTIGFSTITDCECRDDEIENLSLPCHNGRVKLPRREINWASYSKEQAPSNIDGTFDGIKSQLTIVDKTDLYGAVKFASRKFMSSVDRWRYLIVFSDLDEDLPKWCAEKALEAGSLNGVTVYVVNFREVPRYKGKRRAPATRRKALFEHALYAAGASHVEFQNDLRQIIRAVDLER
jgi:hypothetical protein